ncbi:MAG: molybdopterin molybdotransferase MoeA [Acidimicrobiales bacterium]
MLTPIEEVRDAILAACSPLPAAEQLLFDALGCVAAEPVTAPSDVPAWANTAMDGYAVRAEDTADAPARLDVIGMLAAGAAPDPDRPVGPGQAIRIMTGAPMPPGADAVVMVERTQPLDGGAAVSVEVPVVPDENVRHAGDDLRAGQEVVRAGTVFTPALLGVVASVGRDTVTVYRRPRVGVLSTGDELTAPPAALAPGKIYDSNRPMLLATVAAAGWTAVDLGFVTDDADAIAAALEDGLERADAVLLTGGVSVGDFDFVADVFGRLGTTRTWDVAMKPGKPLAWGLLRDRPVFGLPGNPVSAAVSFEVFARPALRLLAGHPEPVPPLVPAVAGERFGRRPDGKVHWVRAVASFDGSDGRLCVRSAGGQGSHMLGALAAGNVLVHLPDGGGVAAGESVQVMALGRVPGG